MKLSTSLFATAAFLAAGAANATIVTAHDNFSSASAGWADSWTIPLATRTTPAPAALKDSALVVTGNSNATAVRVLDTKQTSDVFVDFTLQYSGVLGGNDFVGLWFGNWEGPSIGLKSNCGKTPVDASCTSDLFVRTNGSGGTFLLGSDLTAGASYQVFGHLYKSGKNGNYYDRFDAWFKPTASDLASPVVKFEGKSNITSFTSLGFRSANIDNKVAVTIDNLRVANVPEPGSLALMGLAIAGLAAARRRKKG